MIVGVNNAGVQVIQSRLSPDQIGVYEVDFQVPQSASTGDGLLSLAVNAAGSTQTQFSLYSKINIR